MSPRAQPPQQPSHCPLESQALHGVPEPPPHPKVQCLPAFERYPHQSLTQQPAPPAPGHSRAGPLQGPRHEAHCPADPSSTRLSCVRRSPSPSTAHLKRHQPQEVLWDSPQPIRSPKLRSCFFFLDRNLACSTVIKKKKKERNTTVQLGWCLNLCPCM